MDKTIEVSRDDLIKAFHRWNVEYMKTPSAQANYGEIDERLSTAQRQADHLIWLVQHPK